MRSTSLNAEATIDIVENLIAHYQKALLIKPDSATIHNELGKLYRFQGRHKNAPYHYIKSIQFKPDNFQAYWDLKFSLITLSWYGKTISPGLLNQGTEILSSAAVSQPNFPFAYAVLGDLFTHKGDTQAAIDCYQVSIQNKIRLFRPDLANHTWDTSQKSSPSFLVLGFMRCGTSSLYDYLIAHPQVLPAIDKELGFFSSFFDQGVDWYLAHFPSLTGCSSYLTGEATPFYITSPDTAAKVLNLFPETKFIVLLRNPVERVISAIYLSRPSSLKHIQLEHYVIDALEKAESLMSDLSDASLVQPSSLLDTGLTYWSMLSVIHLLEGLYVFHLKRWFAIFPRDQFLILESENLFRDPATTMRKVHDFLKLPSHQLSNYRNSNPGSYPAVSSDLYHRLTGFYQPYNQQLEEYLDMKFDWE